MRTVLVTGFAGAGRTAVAAATARRDPSALLVTAEDVPGERVLRVDADAFLRRHLAALQERAAPVLEQLGADPLEAEELTGLAGAQSLALLDAWHTARACGRYELLVVDLPPLPQALRLLALPEELRRYLARLLPPRRQAARAALRPFLAQLAGIPAPTARLYAAAERWSARLDGLRAAVEAPGTTVRLVLEPGPRAVRELPALRARLALAGHTLDAVVANRVLPDSADPWLAGLVHEQRRALDELARQLPESGPRLYEVPHLGPGEPAALPVPDVPPAERPAEPWTVDDLLADEGVLRWRLPLPGARRGELELVRRGEELIVGLGPPGERYRRALRLPSALRRCVIERAGLHDGELRVRFAPDPALWPLPARLPAQLSEHGAPQEVPSKA
ncbi:ArsA family ATPase [Streptomyces polyrhachis]|uniref:ArsA family ATPase n=1 Tax=Streptomyces polyrhachis TaxID=1282885 RepID=A0ABW2G7J6_9ACTN